MTEHCILRNSLRDNFKNLKVEDVCEFIAQVKCPPSLFPISTLLRGLTTF